MEIFISTSYTIYFCLAIKETFIQKMSSWPKLHWTQRQVYLSRENQSFLVIKVQRKNLCLRLTVWEG